MLFCYNNQLSIKREHRKEEHSLVWRLTSSHVISELPLVRYNRPQAKYKREHPWLIHIINSVDKTKLAYFKPDFFIPLLTPPPYEGRLGDRAGQGWGCRNSRLDPSFKLLAVSSYRVHAPCTMPEIKETRGLTESALIRYRGGGGGTPWWKLCDPLREQGFSSHLGCS